LPGVATTVPTIAGAPGISASAERVDGGLEPTPLKAVTRKSYGTSTGASTTVHEVPVVVHHTVGAVVAITWYPVTGAPLPVAPDHETFTRWPWTIAAPTVVGAVGFPAGVAVAGGVEDGPVPRLLEAATVKEYSMPLVSPLTVQVRAPVVVQPSVPGVASTA